MALQKRCATPHELYKLRLHPKLKKRKKLHQSAAPKVRRALGYAKPIRPTQMHDVKLNLESVTKVTVCINHGCDGRYAQKCACSSKAPPGTGLQLTFAMNGKVRTVYITQIAQEYHARRKHRRNNQRRAINVALRRLMYHTLFRYRGITPGKSTERGG